MGFKELIVNEILGWVDVVRGFKEWDENLVLWRFYLKISRKIEVGSSFYSERLIFREN